MILDESQGLMTTEARLFMAVILIMDCRDIDIPHNTTNTYYTLLKQRFILWDGSFAMY